MNDSFFFFFQLGQPESENVPTEKDYEIRDLIATLFEKALVKKNWAIVRQTAGNFLTFGWQLKIDFITVVFFTQKRDSAGRSKRNHPFGILFIKIGIVH